MQLYLGYFFIVFYYYNYSSRLAFYLRLKKIDYVKNAKRICIKEFVDMLNILNTSIKVSTSLEESFMYTKEVEKLYGKDHVG